MKKNSGNGQANGHEMIRIFPNEKGPGSYRIGPRKQKIPVQIALVGESLELQSYETSQENLIELSTENKELNAANAYTSTQVPCRDRYMVQLYQIIG